jgi:hypothetical protein
MIRATIVLLLFVSINCYSQSVPNKEVQIKTALLAAPEEQREKALVYGFDEKGQFTTLRQGSNEMICIADDPAAPGLSVACYHKDLEPFMARGRELKKEGKTFQQISDTRESEVKTGKLQMPKQPASLYVYSAADEKYNRETGEVTDGYLRYVIYISYATAESTGLPTKPTAPGMPWIMDPGTHKAHIMINPPPK